ncbi:MAG TPA: biotin transporter BioY [Gemmatimonadales bacterium]|jgi:biotin transport system substrate-specific component|nr:biotin transporter BioY [Gemmatimonadales bacterium]
MGASREVTAGVAAPAAAPARVRPGRRLLGIAVGAVVVAAAAQAAVPVPFSPVPMTLQPLAVLVVGGVLGAAGGVAALVTYLTLGVLGLPVFAGGSSGVIHLLGPTGGYLLAFPVAAGVAGALSRPGAGVLRVLLACALGMVVIHLGGVAQLALLGGDPALALRVGFVPFLTGDLLKVGLAAAVVLGLGPVIRRAR